MNAASSPGPARPAGGWQAAIVDLDGTMVDTVGDFVEALARALADLGLPPVPRGFVLDTIGKGSEHLLRCTLEHLGAPATRVDEAFARYQHHYRVVNGLHSAVYPGVAEGLAALREAGLVLACLTNKPGEFARELLARKGLVGPFTRVAGGDEFARKKPDPLPILATCAALGVSPARTLVVGDSVNDVQAARAAGCPVVVVSYGYNHGEPAHTAGADRVVDRLDELRALL